MAIATALQTSAMSVNCNCSLIRNRFEYQAIVARPTSCACSGNSAPCHVLEIMSRSAFAVLLLKSLEALLAASFLLERARKKTAMVRRGESKREGEMQSAFDWAMIARAPQLQLRINRKRIANQSHSTPNYDHKFSAIIVGSIWATSLAASAD